MAAIAGKKGRVYGATSLNSTAITNEATTANAERTQYQITTAARRYLDANAVTVVETSPDGAEWTPVIPKEIQFAGGVAVFDPALEVGTQVRFANAAYFAIAAVAQCKQWQVDLEIDIEDATVLGDSWKKNAAVMNGWSATLERFFEDTYFSDRIVPAKPVLLVLYVDEAGAKRYEGFATVKGLGVTAPSAGLVQEKVDAEGYGGLYPR